MSNRWLKENSISPDAIDDILLSEHLEPHIKTTCIKESYLKKKPYHVYYRYKVTTSAIPSTSTTAMPNPSNSNETTKTETTCITESEQKSSDPSKKSPDSKIESNSKLDK